MNMSEWRCAFGFPAFYRAVYTDNSPVFQYEIVGILLEGAAPGALPGRVRAARGSDGFSKFVLGERAIPRNLVREIRRLPEEELIRRLRDTGIEDVDWAARRLEILLRSGRVILRETLLRRVLAAAADRERFLAQALSAAVACEGKDLRRLSAGEIAEIAAGRAEPGDAEGEPGKREPVNDLEKGESLLGALIIRLKELGRFDDAFRAAEDRQYREKLYQEFKLA